MTLPRSHREWIQATLEPGLIAMGLMPDNGLPLAIGASQCQDLVGGSACTPQHRPKCRSGAGPHPPDPLGARWLFLALLALLSHLCSGKLDGSMESYSCQCGTPGLCALCAGMARGKEEGRRCHLLSCWDTGPEEAGRGCVFGVSSL